MAKKLKRKGAKYTAEDPVHFLSMGGDRESWPTAKKGEEDRKNDHIENPSKKGQPINAQAVIGEELRKIIEQYREKGRPGTVIHENVVDGCRVRGKQIHYARKRAREGGRISTKPND